MSSDSDTLIFGIHAVSRALAAGKVTVKVIFLQSGRDDAAIKKLRQSASDRGIRIELVSREQMEQMAGDARHQGVVATVDSLPAMDSQGLSDMIDAIDKPFLLALDGVQDPHNLGACLRSAE
ncbi:MAG: 23S rRNA (guanosine(2251)-2'-O)-methyltransferase RlmB, partial [Gammaproteobacteria bacterium]|nr:23S rRNA (guanosine(2251)-2'-O)-methyltransferase RlmB [Gammaproteobacteria bacterium]